MSDAFGEIEVELSDDFEGSLWELCRALNAVGSAGVDWASSFGAFESENGTVSYSSSTERIQYPSVFPHRLAAYIEIMPDGSEVQRSAEAIDYEDPEEIGWEPIFEEVALAEIGRSVGQHLRKGCIVITAFARESGKNCYFERLRICADGGATRTRRAIASCEDVVEQCPANLA